VKPAISAKRKVAARWVRATPVSLTLGVDAPAGVVDPQPLKHLQQRGVPTNETGGAAPDVALARRLGRRCGGRVGTVTGFARVGHVHRSIS
jgi:hypothetical protein